MVAIVPRKKDWQILRESHWYRIPVKSAPVGIKKVKYLAFYQPKIFAEEKWAVNYYAPVLGWAVVKRRDLLPDEPKHPNLQEDYYKITIADLVKLPRPIKSQRRRRITFIPTTLEKLFSAKEINDLFLTSPIEEKLYAALKEKKISCERQYFVKEEDRTYCLDFAIFCQNGKIAVECDGESYHSARSARLYDRERDNELTSYGWHILRFYGGEIKKNTRACIKRIRRTIKSLRGIRKDKTNG